MSYYGKGDVSADFPGIARRKLQAESPDVFHIYCSGASGDTMAGRYNDGNPANRQILAGRLYQAMAAAWRATQRAPLNQIDFRSAKFMFQPRKDQRYSVEELNRVLASDTAPRREKLDAALGISWLRRVARRRPIELPAVHLGSAAIVVVPAEAFVQYQLWAQQAAPQKTVMTLGYGECAPGYIPTNDGRRGRLRRPLQLGRFHDVRSHTSTCHQRGARFSAPVTPTYLTTQPSCRVPIDEQALKAYSLENASPRLLSALGPRPISFARPED